MSAQNSHKQKPNVNQIGQINHNTPPKTEKGFLIYKCNKDTEMFIGEMY